MVSLWPWKADETASFEKTLSALTTKINKANVQTDRLRSRARRFKVLWTLYTSFAYILYSIILALVTGTENWGPVEYAAVVGGPFIIYLVRAALSTYYEYRLSSKQAHLDDLQQQRESAIEKFKAATKYNSTQQLLEKYGAAPKGSSATSTPSSSGKRKSGQGLKERNQQQQQQQQSPRTNLPPPPTANIQRPAAPASPGNQVPATPPPPPQQAPPSPPQQPAPSPLEPSASFAPNAYPQYYAVTRGAEGDAAGPNWYDRILDLLMGEDETRAVNRLALICSSCRLVNGQAPPGVKRLEDVGRWRCVACRAWNGLDMSEIDSLVRATDGKGAVEAENEGMIVTNKDQGGLAGVGEGSLIDSGVAVGEEQEEADSSDYGDAEIEQVEPPSRSTRSRTKVESD